MPTKSDAQDILVDTNVLVYAYDPAEAWKMRRAQETLARLEAEGRGVVSTQVLSEFYTVAIKKTRPPLKEEEADRAVRAFISSWYVLPLTTRIVAEALRGVRRYRFNYWDALIWATAREAGARTVLTEDFTDGSTIEGIGFRNPFADAFSLDAALAR
jgi:predicted nucleic acid-binding protein